MEVSQDSWEIEGSWLGEGERGLSRVEGQNAVDLVTVESRNGSP